MFFYSLPLFFSETHLGSPLELLLLVLTLLVVLLISAPATENYLEEKTANYSLYHYVLYAWQGQLSLWRVFWPFFILLNLGIFTADCSAKSAWISVSSWDDAHFMFFVPSIFWTISVWRNSENTSSQFEAGSTRLMTILVFFEYGVKILIRHQYPQIFFDCQENLVDYISCF